MGMAVSLKYMMALASKGHGADSVNPFMHEENMSDNQNDKQQAGSQSCGCSQVDLEKRNFLIATSAVGALGCAVAACLY